MPTELTKDKAKEAAEAAEVAEDEEVRANNAFRLGIIVVGIIIFAWAYSHIGQTLISQRNNEVEQILGGDQKNNIKMAVQTRQDFHTDIYQGVAPSIYALTPRRTDGVINPVWPWMAAWLTTKDHKISGDKEVSEDDRKLFDSGRRFALKATMVFLIVLGLALGIAGYSAPAVFNVLLLGGLGALLPRCAFFQPEPIYYVMLFMCWACALALIIGNHLPLYLAFGGLLGMTYMVKASIQPLLAAFLAVTAYQCVRNIIEVVIFRKRDMEARVWKARNCILGLIITVVGFLVFAGPRLYYANDKYGSMFHSYPSYWMWMDNFDEAYEFMRDHGDAEKLQALTDEDKPSFTNYRKDHTNEEMWNRLSDGFWMKTSEFLASDAARRDKEPRRHWRGVLEYRGHYLIYLAFVAVALLVAMRFGCRRPEAPGESISPEAGPAVIFVLGTFAIAALAYGWYSPIGRGERFMLSLYLPLVFSFVAAADHLYRKALRRKAKPWFVGMYYTLQTALTVLLTWRVYELFSWPHFTP